MRQCPHSKFSLLPLKGGSTIAIRFLEKRKTRAEEGVGIFICVALQRLDLSKTHGAYLFYVPLRNLEPVNLNPEPVAPATRLERKEAHLFFFRQSFENAHGV